MNKTNLRYYQGQLLKSLTALEAANAEAVEILNKMLLNNEVNNISDDIEYALDNDFCKGENLLRGFLEVIDEQLSK